jgi:hypothetical protein
MLKILGDHYYFDLDEIEDFINVDPVGDDFSGDTTNQISVVKYEMVKMLIDTVLTEDSEVDETLGLKGTNDLSIPFKLSFNSLLNKKLINKY